MFTANGSMFLSSILSFYPAVDAVGHGVILDSSMQIRQRLHTPHTLVPFNMHEFAVMNDGKTAMHIVQKVELADMSHLSTVNGAKSGLVVNMGIREFEVETGRDMFIWWAQDHMNLDASVYAPRHINGPYPNGWDWM